MNTRTAYIAIVGRPNVGKSTLLNALLGEKIAIVSNKPQTTRNRILGILTEGNDQYVFLDTPGVFTPRNALGEFMVKTAGASVGDSDVVILMVDASGRITSVEENIIENIKKAGIPSILAVNKTDLVSPEEIAQCLQTYSEKHDFDAYVPLCAKNGKNTKVLLSECEKFLVESEWLFPEDMISDQPERQLVAEIIREKLLQNLDKEVPHGVAVEIEMMKEENGVEHISAVIYCERKTHKGIIIGKNGAMLKKVGATARPEIEELLDCKVFLQLWVKIKEDWRNNPAQIRNFGYSEEG